MVVGPGFRFLSGLSHYTYQLSISLAEAADVSVVLLRQLIPTRLYPGRERVGVPLADVRYPPAIPVYDGIDWFWGRTLLGGLRFLRAHRPDLVVLQWWTGAVLHTHIALALAARALRARVVVEFHEVQDPSEARLRAARTWLALLARALVRLADGFVIHSEADRAPLELSLGMRDRPVAVIAHGPYRQYALPDGAPAIRPAPSHACNLLFFGLIRPYKGLEDAIRAFDALGEEDEAGDFWLTIVGETWEDWRVPDALIAASRHRDRLTFVNRYVPDAEAARYLAGADVVVLPYRRASASGTLHVAMALGLPVVTTRVGGLVEAASGYEGAVLVEPGDPVALRAAFRTAAAMTGTRYADPHSWERTRDRYLDLLRQLTGASEE